LTKCALSIVKTTKTYYYLAIALWLSKKLLAFLTWLGAIFYTFV